MAIMTAPEQKLTGFRARIDALDEQLARLLIERTGIIHEVAALKRENWPGACHIRPGREGEMHRALAARFAGTAFPVRGALAIWRQLIGASTHLESPLNAVFLVEHPHHAWLAREYFGVQVGINASATLKDALAPIASGKSNLLILPAPTQSDWWRDAQTLREAGLSVFAALPVIDPLPEGAQPAVALAAVTPEPSGDDISYFVQNGKLIVQDGFKNSHEDAVFLGAHPRPITLGA
jgi:chorismate mutase